MFTSSTSLRDALLPDFEFASCSRRSKYLARASGPCVSATSIACATLKTSATREMALYTIWSGPPLSLPCSLDCRSSSSRLFRYFWLGATKPNLASWASLSSNTFFMESSSPFISIGTVTCLHSRSLKCT